MFNNKTEKSLDNKSIIWCVFVFAFLLPSFYSFGQADNEKDDIFNTAVNNPYKIPKLYIDVTPLLYSAQWNQNVGFGVKADYDLSETIDIHGNFEMQYPKASFQTFMDWLLPQGYNYNMCNPLLLDIGLSYSISDKVRDEIATLTVSAYKSSNDSYTFFGSRWLNTDVKHRKKSSIRFGAMQYRSNFILPSKDLLITKDGSIFNIFSSGMYNDDGFVVFGDINYKKLYRNYDKTDYNSTTFTYIDGQVRTISDFYGLTFGYITSDIINTVMQIDDYGVGGITTYKTFYIDGIIGRTVLRPFEFYESNTNAVVYGEELSNTTTFYEIDTHMSKLKQNMFGFRLGWAYHIPLISKIEDFEKRNKILEKPAYFTFYHEIGLHPGYGILKNLYYKIGMSVELNFF